VAFIKALPFREIGRCLVFGLEANDHAPLHRDTEPGSKDTIDHSLSICPRGDKRLYLSDPEEKVKLVVRSRVYWFNDMDYHGVLPDPYFRYSIRIDGVFEPWFVEVARKMA
jgi:Rieske 2Fe-2S family protein